MDSEVKKLVEGLDIKFPVRHIEADSFAVFPIMVDAENNPLFSVSAAKMSEIKQWGDLIAHALNNLISTPPQSLQSANDWETMESAPKDEEIEVAFDEQKTETCIAVWSERPVCMLGPVNGGFPAGWATAGGQTDSNLPLDTPLYWRPIANNLQPKEESQAQSNYLEKYGKLFPPSTELVEWGSWIEQDEKAGKLILDFLANQPGTSPLHTISLKLLRRMVIDCQFQTSPSAAPERAEAEECPDCNGTGMGFDSTDCPKCKGYKTVEAKSPTDREIEGIAWPLSYCHESGFIKDVNGCHLTKVYPEYGELLTHALNSLHGRRNQVKPMATLTTEQKANLMREVQNVTAAAYQDDIDLAEVFDKYAPQFRCSGTARKEETPCDCGVQLVWEKHSGLLFGERYIDIEGHYCPECGELHSISGG